MSKLLKSTILVLLGCIFASCGTNNSTSLCADASADSYSPEFQILCPTQGSDYYVPVKYGCPPHGQGISPPIQWKGIPDGTTHLHLMVVDATCTYECNSCCQFNHWILDIPLADLPETGPISRQGIEEGAATSAMALKYTQKNTLKQNAYMPFCPPVIQTHAYVFQMIAFKEVGGKREVLGRTQSMPLLFSLQR